MSDSLPNLNASSGHVELARQLGTFLRRWECCATIRFVQYLELTCVGSLALFLDDGFFSDQHGSRLLSEHTVRHCASSIWRRTMAMGFRMRRDSTFVLIYSTQRYLMRVTHGRVLGRVAAWIGHRRIGIGVRLELGVFGRIGCGGGGNVCIVGDGMSHRTITGALPAVIPHCRSRHAEWRKFSRPLRICGDGSGSSRLVCRICWLLIS